MIDIKDSAQPHESSEKTRYAYLLNTGRDLQAGSNWRYKQLRANFSDTEYWLLEASNVKMGTPAVLAWADLGMLYAPDTESQPNAHANAVKSRQFFLKAGEAVTNEPGLQPYIAEALYNAAVSYSNDISGLERNRFIAVQLLKRAAAMKEESASTLLAKPELTNYQKWDHW